MYIGVCIYAKVYWEMGTPTGQRWRKIRESKRITTRS